MKRVVVLTNLYPSAAAPGRGIFNFHKFNALAKLHDMNLFVPVQWPQWYQNTSFALDPPTEIPTVYFPSYYTPKIARRYYGEFLYWSLQPVLPQIEACQAQVVLASYAYPDGYAGMKLTQRLGLPLVTALHGSDINVHIENPARRKRLLKALSASNAIVSVSQDLVDCLVDLGISSEKCHTIYNGVDMDRFIPANQSQARAKLGLAANQKIVLYVGNLLATKGILDLVKAMPAAIATHPDAHAVLVGAGADFERASKLAEQLGVAKKVYFAGAQPHNTLPDWLAACDLLCLPSYREGVPNVVLEAIACGRPVVASSVGGVPEVTSQANALLVKPGCVDELAAALSESLATQWDSQEISSSSVAGTWQKNAQRLSDVINNV